MMKRSLFFTICLASLLFYSCNDNKKSNELEPTIANLAGTWVAESYKLNGKEISRDQYPYDYIHVGQDARFTARFSLIEALENQAGYCYGSGTVRNGTISLLANSITIRSEVNSLTEKRLTVKNTEGYVQHYSRVSDPTLYRVANKTTSSPEEQTVIISMALDPNGHVPFQSVHGSVPSGTVCDQLVYTTEPNAMHLLIRRLDNTGRIWSYLTAYPQKIVEGTADNVIFVADTTLVIEIDEFGTHTTKVNLSSRSAKPFSEWMEEVGE